MSDGAGMSPQCPVPGDPLPDEQTPESGWPAQPALTPREAFLQIVRDDILTMVVAAWVLEQQQELLKQTAVREDLRRDLAGVIAHCETLRLALEKGRM